MTVTVIIVLVLLVLGCTTVFYAWNSQRVLNQKTGIAALGFLLIFVALLLVGPLMS